VRTIAPYLDPKSWGAIVYVWLAFPLGLIWFLLLTIGLLTGAALSLIWVGLFILAFTLLAAWGAEGLERQLANLLLGARVAERRIPRHSPEGMGAWLGSVARSPGLWKGLMFLGLRFPLGLAGWIFSVVSLAVSGAFLAAPFVVFAGGHIDLDLSPIMVDDITGSWALAVAGYVLLVVSFHLHRGLGWFWARTAELLLAARVDPMPTPAPPAALETASA